MTASDGNAGIPVIVRSLGMLELEESSLPVYDRPIGLRLLFADPVAGAEHYLVHYPKGLVAKWHRHTAAHTIVVLAGELEANGEVIAPGSYCHFPAGVRMHHAPAAGRDCLFVIMFSGPFDVEVLDP